MIDFPSNFDRSRTNIKPTVTITPVEALSLLRDATLVTATNTVESIKGSGDEDTSETRTKIIMARGYAKSIGYFSGGIWFLELTGEYEEHGTKPGDYFAYFLLGVEKNDPLD